MSEPVSNAEIEDVLSSIRRLVSENSGAKDNASGQSKSTEKLVLTPAFRVLERADDENHEADDPRAQILREMEAQATADDDAPEEDAAQDHPPQPVHAEADRPEDEGLEQRIAELEAVIGDTYDEWEPDGSEEDVEEAAPIIFKTNDSTSEVVDGPDEDEFAMDPEPAPASEPSQEDELTAAEQGEVFTPEFDIEDVIDDAFLDEDALRDMVSQLVREELHGAIGERITSNVRRLVRREIKRALAIRDLE